MTLVEHVCCEIESTSCHNTDGCRALGAVPIDRNSPQSVGAAQDMSVLKRKIPSGTIPLGYNITD
jgi:hypothetical protein